jgi:uncharacterized protein YndB with AHSA1/START domain
MAKLEVITRVPLDPELTWTTASDLHRFDEWLTIHDGWRSDLPEQLAVGTTAESVVSVRGMRNRVAWKVEEIDIPHHLVLRGSGKGGTRFRLVLSVAGTTVGSDLSLKIDLGGAPLFGPIGAGVARTLRGDLEASLRKFAELYG